MKLLYGTGNPAKLAAMRSRLAALPVEVLGLKDMPAPPPQAEDPILTVCYCAAETFP